MEKYSNKRLLFRERGKFRKSRPQDFGIGGVCECGHLLVRVYEGKTGEPFPDPSKFRYRCFNCEPKGENE